MTRIQKFLTLNGASTIMFLGIIAFIFLSPNTNTLHAQIPSKESNNDVLISKQSSNSYSIDNDTAFIKPFFDTTYIISGSSSSFNNSQDLINSTIINDFISSPTIGYIVQINNNNNNNNTNLTHNQTVRLPSVPNPFVDIANVTHSISDHLSNAVSFAIKSNLTDVDIKCVFGNSIKQWTCEVYSLPP